MLMTGYRHWFCILYSNVVCIPSVRPSVTQHPETKPTLNGVNKMAGDPTCKLILLGNGSVGKTSIIDRFVNDGFTRVYKQTVGLDFFEKRVELRTDKRVLVQVRTLANVYV